MHTFDGVEVPLEGVLAPLPPVPAAVAVAVGVGVGVSGILESVLTLWFGFVVDDNRG